MKKLFCILMAAALLVVAVACGGTTSTTPSTSEAAETISEEKAKELRNLSLELLGYLQADDTPGAFSMMSEEMKEALGGDIQGSWAQVEAVAGEFEETGAWQASLAEGYHIIEMTLVFTQRNMVYRTVFDSENVVVGFSTTFGEVDGGSAAEPAPQEPAPEGVVQENVVVDAGGWPLDGILTLPAEGAPAAAVIILHGSGPGDKDGTMGVNTPYKDIAEYLAAQSIAVLRFDKRTLTHGAAIVGDADAYARFTFDEETAFDAVAAAELLRARDDIPADKIFLLGHSQSGGMLAYINTLGADAAGYISLAGTPRKLWEISADQNMLVAEEYEAAGDTETEEVIHTFVAAELEKAESLVSMTDEEALAETVMGLPAWYQRHMAGIDAPALHLADEKPLLVLQGGSDRQVTETDFTAWQTELAAHPDATFKLYPALNHSMGAYTGEPLPFLQLTEEYNQPTPVDEELLQDLAGWILAHT